MAADPDYQVGYKRPPLGTRWKEGQSGNLRGRPRGTQNFPTLLRKALNKKITVIEDGRRRQITKLEAGATQLATRTAQGDFKVTQYVVEKTEEIESIDASDERVSVSRDLDDDRDEIRGLLHTVRDRLLQAQPGRTNGVGDGPGAGDGAGEDET
jgi:hypothetical protein